MVDFCKECSIELFGEDHGDFVYITEPGSFIQVLCKGCGWIWVDSDGERVDNLESE